MLLLSPVPCSLSPALAQQPQTSTAPVFSANAKYVQGVGPGYWPTAGSGLTLNIAAGTAFCNAQAISYAGGSLSMSPSATNYVFLDPISCLPGSNTTGFTVGQIPLAQATTDASAVTGVEDLRNWFQSVPCTTDANGSVDCRPSGAVGGYMWLFATAVGAGMKPIVALYNDTTGYVYGDIEGESTYDGTIFYGEGRATVRSAGAVELDPGGTNSVLLPRLDNIRFASQFSGADWAEKINAADADIGPGVPGVIYVSSSLAGTAAATLTPSANKKVVFMGGTFSSSAVPNVRIVSSGVSIEGTGTGLNSTATTLNNTGTGDCIVLGNGATEVRGVSIGKLRIEGNASGLSGIKLEANVGNVVLQQIQISSPGTYGIDGSAGNYLLVELNQVRVELAKDFAFRFDAAAPAGPVLFYQTYANGTTGSTSIGYEVSNGDYTLVGTAADANTRGYRIGGTVRMFGTSSEASTTYGVNVVGSGNVTVVGHFSVGDATPFNIDAAGANTLLMNPRSTSTTGAFSVSVGAASTGDNRIVGESGLDKPINVLSGGILHRWGASGLSVPTGISTFKAFHGTVNTVAFSTTPSFDATLGNTQQITLTENVTSSTLANASAGQHLEFIVCQDATGGRTFTWPSNVKGAMTVGTTSSTCSAQNFIFDGTNAYALSPGVTDM